MLQAAHSTHSGAWQCPTAGTAPQTLRYATWLGTVCPALAVPGRGHLPYCLRYQIRASSSLRSANSECRRLAVSLISLCLVDGSRLVRTRTSRRVTYYPGAGPDAQVPVPPFW